VDSATGQCCYQDVAAHQQHHVIHTKPHLPEQGDIGQRAVRGDAPGTPGPPGEAAAEGICMKRRQQRAACSAEGVALMGELMSWYLQSMGDADTHRGELQPDGTVSAVCGIRFRPIDLPLGGISLSSYPLDPDQICPKCAY